MAPTVFIHGKFRFFFFSREEKRMHVHIETPDGEAKFWLEPVIALAESIGLKPKELMKIQRLVEENQSEIIKSWKKHFQS
jgi:hypothetical protein